MNDFPHKLVFQWKEESAIRCVRFNSDGDYCLTCGSDKYLKLWNPYKGTLLNTYKGHGYEVLDAASSTDNSQLVSCSADRTVVLWDVATGKVLRKYRGHLSRVNCVVFNKTDSSVVLSGSYDATVRCWDTRSRSLEPIQVIEDAKDSISSVEVTEHEILTGSVDGYTRLYDVRSGRLTEDCMGEPVVCACFTNDQQCLVVASLDNTIRLIDKDTGEMLNSFTGHTNKEYKLDSFASHSDRHIISGSEDGSIFFWDLIEAKVVHKLSSAHKGAVYSMSLHPKKSVLLSAGSDCVKLWTSPSEEEEKAVKVEKYKR